MANGLTSLEVQRRLLKFGSNVIVGKKRQSLIFQFLKQFKDLMVIILIVAALFAFFAGERVDGSIIIGIVILNAAIGFAQEFKAEKAIEALKKLLAPRARVIRDGEEQLIDAKELVPGDLVILSEGDKIGADCELVEENEIGVDESVLTGESVSVGKDTDKNKNIFMGTQITHGTGRAVVVKTGMNTEFGRIATLTTETKKDLSPLQKELAHIGLFVGKITIGISAILFLIGIFVQGRQFADTLLFAVSVAVAAVPEGLPATITVALALGVQRLAKKNAIIKQLSSVETLGSTTVICSDKTGTLTKNEMTVQEMKIGEFEILARGVGYEPQGNFLISDYNPGDNTSEHNKEDLSELAFKKPIFYRHFELAMRTAIICNNARLVESDSRWQILGDPTEGALLTVAEKAGFLISHTNDKFARIAEIPFDSARKRMSVIAQETDTASLAAYVKGAPDSLLDVCTHIFKDGHAAPMTEKDKDILLKRIDFMASRALRTIALAYKTLPREKKKKYTKDEIESNLVFVGLMGMTDPPREEVKDAVALTRHAGIKIFIITGDHGATAAAIAKELGIVRGIPNIVTGDMLNQMSDEELLKLTNKQLETIFARVNPEHKLRIVDALKRSGEIVAVTGDGVNDAPALKRADIGIAMGITGTDVSREAANMVLTDDSFRSIVSAVVEGRTIYENMKKFIYYIFSSNIGEVLAVFSTIVIGLPAPLTAIFILLINTLTDVFPALALGVEPVEHSILEKPPRKPDSKIMEWPFIRRYLIAGIWIGLISTGAFMFNLWAHGWHYGEALSTDSPLYIQSATMSFVALTLLQMVHAWNSRSATVSALHVGFFTNWHLLLAIASSTLATVAFVQIPFFQKYLKTAPLSLNQWLFLISLSLSILVFEEIRKSIQWPSKLTSRSAKTS